jgi:hypothetical protein
MNPYGQERLDGVAVPPHRLVLVPALGHDLCEVLAVDSVKTIEIGRPAR